MQGRAYVKPSPFPEAKHAAVWVRLISSRGGCQLGTGLIEGFDPVPGKQ
jgi:hypothetical protein